MREEKKIMLDTQHIDNIIIRGIITDMQNGSLLLEADNETLKMIMIHMHDVRDKMTQKGAIIGEA